MTREIDADRCLVVNFFGNDRLGMAATCVTWPDAPIPETGDLVVFRYARGLTQPLTVCWVRFEPDLDCFGFGCVERPGED